jgi:hypothetical protein
LDYVNKIAISFYFWGFPREILNISGWSYWIQDPRPVLETLLNSIGTLQKHDHRFRNKKLVKIDLKVDQWWKFMLRHFQHF